MKTKDIPVKILSATLIEKEEEDRSKLTLKPKLQSWYHIELEIDGRHSFYDLFNKSWEEFDNEK